MEFEWDEAKNEANLAKHGIDFDDAIGIFNHRILERVDNRREYGETRTRAIGLSSGRELFIVYTMRGEIRRIVSARRASINERRAYRQA